MRNKTITRFIKGCKYNINTVDSKSDEVKIVLTGKVFHAVTWKRDKG
jgi:hypothetical protein